jgi:hypothetical protein
MAVKCPKCHSENPETVKFCGECGIPFIPREGPQVSKTLAIEDEAEGLTRGTVFAGRYQHFLKLSKDADPGIARG